MDGLDAIAFSLLVDGFGRAPWLRLIFVVVEVEFWREG